MRSSLIAASLVVALGASGCRGGLLIPAILGTAIVTAAVVGSRPPPPPTVVYVPGPRPDWSWQPSHWELDGGRWVWIEGQWVSDLPGYAWRPSAWRRDPDGRWQLIPGAYVPTERHRRDGPG